MFGRVNLIDAALMLFVFALIPMGVAAYNVFRERPPRIDAVQPASQPAGLRRRVRLKGENFRPFLRIFFGPAGQPFSLLGHKESSIAGTFVLESPSEVEVELPPLSAGTYDLHVYDENHEILLRPAAVTLEAAPPTLTARVRFAGPPEAVSLLKPGDADLSEIAAATTPDAAPRAVIEAVTPAGGGAVDVRILMPAAQDPLGLWRYGSQPIRVGQEIVFETSRYALRGVVLAVVPR